MDTKPEVARSKNFFLKIKDKIISFAGIDDSSMRIAAGFGIGVFLGVFPGSGPTASLVVSFLLRVNKVSALAGSVLINTWINIITFPIAIALGSLFTGISPEVLTKTWENVFQDFTWEKLWTWAVLKTIAVIIVGFIIIGIILGIIGFFVSYILINAWRTAQTPRE